MNKTNLNVNWKKDPYLKRWLKNKKEGTRNSYLSAFRAYSEFTGMTATQMIEESDKELTDPNLKPSERKIVKTRVEDFFSYVKTDYERRARGSKKGESKPVGRRPKTGEKGIAEKTAAAYVGAIRGFYKQFGHPMYFQKGTFDAEPENRRFNWTISDIHKLVEHAKSTRDRAIILCQFQSGSDD